MAVDNRLVVEYQENTLTFDIGVATGGGDGTTSVSGLYGGAIMPYRQTGTGGLSDGLAPVSGLATPGELDSVNKQFRNRAILFENEVHAIGQGNWYRQRADDQTWEVIAAWDSDSSGDHVGIGLYAAFNQITNKRYLFTAIADGFSGRDWRVIRYDPQLQIVETGITTSQQNSSTDFCYSETQWRNCVYFCGTDIDTYILVADPFQMKVNTILAEQTLQSPHSMCTYNDKLYMATHKNSGSGIIVIRSLTGTGGGAVELELPFENYALPATWGSNFDSDREECVLFVDNCPATRDNDGPAMWLYYQTNPEIPPSGGGGVRVEGYSVWKIKEINGQLQVVYQNDSMMGSNFRAGFFENTIPTTQNANAVLNYCTNYPGWFKSTPERSFFVMRPFGGEPGETYKQWDFDPDDPTATPDGGATTGGPAKVSFVQDNLGGGSRWSPAAPSTVTSNDVNIFDIVYTSGYFTDENYDTWRIHYKLMPSQAYHAGTGVNVRWYFDQYHAPTTRCSLSATSHGSLSGNTVLGVTMLSGVDYYVDWNITSDDLSYGSGIYLVGLAYTDSADIGSV